MSQACPNLSLSVWLLTCRISICVGKNEKKLKKERIRKSLWKSYSKESYPADVYLNHLLDVLFCRPSRNERNNYILTRAGLMEECGVLVLSVCVCEFSTDGRAKIFDRKHQQLRLIRPNILSHDAPASRVTARNEVDETLRDLGYEGVQEPFSHNKLVTLFTSNIHGAAWLLFPIKKHFCLLTKDKNNSEQIGLQQQAELHK